MKVALLSDIHANIYALESVYKELNKECVDRILVCGDIVGYYYWPKEVVTLLMGDPRVLCIAGNHEHILREVMVDACAADRYRAKYGSGYDICLSSLTRAELDWLLAIEDFLELEIAGKSFYLAHGSLGSTDRYLYPDTDLATLKSSYSQSDFTVFGHTHYPFLHGSGNRYLINPGSVGQPRDAGGIASFVIVDLENLAIRFKRRRFDVASVVSAAKSKDPDVEYLWKIMSR